MSFNLHANLHLPEHVMRFGPLQKQDCFRFENQFKITRNLFYGTRNWQVQIVNNLEGKKMCKVELNSHK